MLTMNLQTYFLKNYQVDHRNRFYSSECVSLRCTSTISEKERWYIEIVYRLQTSEQSYGEE
ncbi:hypothetical protein EPI10_020796 [Gossypium australe]|uniref:Uncharacterized protein n=1 Tax=Gossypium australe TaxID=47621 RepID=A0A5B6WGQ4_9ROSI|nr:hypothetical protein EPI10_020796 [Gossypium australe]